MEPRTLPFPLLATTVLGNGETKDDALQAALAQVPESDQIVAAHWLNATGAELPEWRWMVVVAYIATPQPQEPTEQEPTTEQEPA